MRARPGPGAAAATATAARATEPPGLARPRRQGFAAGGGRYDTTQAERQTIAASRPSPARAARRAQPWVCRRRRQRADDTKASNSS